MHNYAKQRLFAAAHNSALRKRASGCYNNADPTPFARPLTHHGPIAGGVDERQRRRCTRAAPCCPRGSAARGAARHLRPAEHLSASHHGPRRRTLPLRHPPPAGAPSITNAGRRVYAGPQPSARAGGASTRQRRHGRTSSAAAIGPSHGAIGGGTAVHRPHRTHLSIVVAPHHRAHTTPVHPIMFVSSTQTYFMYILMNDIYQSTINTTVETWDPALETPPNTDAVGYICV